MPSPTAEIPVISPRSAVLKKITDQRTKSKFTYYQNPVQVGASGVRFFSFLGTDTKYEEQDATPAGETLSSLFNCTPGATIFNGPTQEGAYCYNPHKVPAHALAVMLEQLADNTQPVEIFNINGHSRGGIGAILVSHELDRIKDGLLSLASEDRDNIAKIKQIIIGSQDPDTKAILEIELSKFSDEQIRNLINNIEPLRLNLYLLDPVPGNFNWILPGYNRWQDSRICSSSNGFEIAKISKHVVIGLAAQERTHGFDCAQVIARDPAATRIIVDSLPGHHATASGNIADRNGSSDGSFFVRLKRKLIEQIANCRATTVVEDDEESVEYVLSPRTGANCQDFNFSGLLGSYSIENNQEFIQEFDSFIVQELGQDYLDLIKRDLKDEASLSFIEYAQRAYSIIRQDLLAVQQITTSRMIEFFCKHSKVDRSFFRVPERVESETSSSTGLTTFDVISQQPRFKTQYDVISAILDNIFDSSMPAAAAAAASPAVARTSPTASEHGEGCFDSRIEVFQPLSRLEQVRYEKYERVKLLKKYFDYFKTTFYSGLEPLSKDEAALGRQVRKGTASARLQDWIYLPHDDSAFVCAEHRDLHMRMLITKLTSEQILEEITPEKKDLSPLMHNIDALSRVMIEVANKSQARTSPSQSHGLWPTYHAYTSPDTSKFLPEKVQESIKDLLISLMSQVFRHQNQNDIIALKENLQFLKELNLYNKLFINEETSADVGTSVSSEAVIKAHAKSELAQLAGNVIQKALDSFKNDLEKIASDVKVRVENIQELMLTKTIGEQDKIEDEIQKIIHDIDWVSSSYLFIIEHHLNIDERFIDKLKDEIVPNVNELKAKLSSYLAKLDQDKKQLEYFAEQVKKLEQQGRLQEKEVEVLQRRLEQVIAQKQSVIEEKAKQENVLLRRIHQLQADLSAAQAAAIVTAEAAQAKIALRRFALVQRTLNADLELRLKESTERLAALSSISTSHNIEDLRTQLASAIAELEIVKGEQFKSTNQLRLLTNRKNLQNNQLKYIKAVSLANNVILVGLMVTANAAALFILVPGMNIVILGVAGGVGAAVALSGAVTKGVYSYRNSKVEQKIAEIDVELTPKSVLPTVLF